MKKYIYIFLLFIFAYQANADTSHYAGIKLINMEIFRNGEVIGYSNYFFEHRDNTMTVKNYTKFKVKLLGATIFSISSEGIEKYEDNKLFFFKSNTFQNNKERKYEGEMDGRKNGALISMEKGKAVAFAIFNLQARGEMFVTHNDSVYAGMIVGLATKPGDMIINVMKGKKLTNMRTQGTDENVVLTPIRKMSIAEQLSILNGDEALEITPKSCRLRKAILDP